MLFLRPTATHLTAANLIPAHSEGSDAAFARLKPRGIPILVLLLRLRDVVPVELTKVCEEGQIALIRHVHPERALR